MPDIDYITRNLNVLLNSLHKRDSADIARFLKRMAYAVDDKLDPNWRDIRGFRPPTGTPILVYGKIYRENNRWGEPEQGSCIVVARELEDEREYEIYEEYNMPHRMKFSLIHNDYYETVVAPTHWALVEDPLGSENWTIPVDISIDV